MSLSTNITNVYQDEQTIYWIWTRQASLDVNRRASGAGSKTAKGKGTNYEQTKGLKAHQGEGVKGPKFNAHPMS